MGAAPTIRVGSVLASDVTATATSMSESLMLVQKTRREGERLIASIDETFVAVTRDVDRSGAVTLRAQMPLISSQPRAIRTSTELCN